ncbi:MAG: deoxyribose-phosphate aldolase, partial [Bacteroidota bacterium]
VKLCAQLLRDTSVKVCTVIGFPLGATSTESKTFETERAIKDGAREVDMVINVGMLKSGEFDYVQNDILAVVHAAHRNNVLAKVIIETGLLTDEEKIKACVLAKRAGADFVKTSTGFAKGGATVGDIALMRLVVGPDLGIKASGGVRTQEQAKALIESGADRIGASASVKIVTGEKESTPASY